MDNAVLMYRVHLNKNSAAWSRFYLTQESIHVCCCRRLSTNKLMNDLCSESARAHALVHTVSVHE